MPLRDSRGRFIKAGSAGGGVQVIDRGWKSLTERMRAMSGKGEFVAVGIQGDAAGESHGEGLTNSQLAAFHEFGTVVMPERSFIRSTFDKQMDDTKRRVDKLGKDFFTPGPVNQPKDSLLFIGEQLAGAMKATMKAGIAPEKADGSPAFLIESGQLWNSISAAFVDPEGVR